MRSVVLGLVVVGLLACSGGPAPFEGIIPGPPGSIQVDTVPLLSITNANFYDAVVYLNERKFIEVPGLSAERLFLLEHKDVRGDRKFAVKIRFIGPGWVLQLPTIDYRAGKKMRIAIAPGNPPTTSTAW